MNSPAGQQGPAVNARPTTAHLLRALRRTTIEVPAMSNVNLVVRACAHYNERNPGKRPADPLSVTTNVGFVQRICVNYLRHAATSYDRNRDVVSALARTPQAREQIGQLVKELTLKAIAETYPQLATEARRQQRATQRPPQQGRR